MLDEFVAVLTEAEPWRADAACAGQGTDLWFPERGAPSEPAKAVCAGCPVQLDCADFARRHHIQVGVWGGQSGRERRTRKRQRPAAPLSDRLPAVARSTGAAGQS